jgi:hypothetical protein
VGPVGTSVTLPAFSNNKGITGDSKLNIVYDVQSSAGLSFSTVPYITSFNPSTRALGIQTANTAVPRNNALKMVAYFSYRPTYKGTLSNKVEWHFSVILDNCFTTSISTPTATQILYYVGMHMMTQTLSGWTNSLGTDCEPFHRLIKPTSRPRSTASKSNYSSIHSLAVAQP